MEKDFKEIKFIDESGDKKYFTIIPNIVVNGYTATESGVYLYIKRKCGESKDGTWWETKERVAKNLGLSVPFLRKIMRKLEKDKRIQFIGTTVFKTSPVKVYKMCDIWKENSVEYVKERDQKQNSISQEVKKRDQKMTMVTDQKQKLLKKNPIKNNNNILEKTSFSKVKKLTSFKNESYNTVLEKYQELKGIELKGEEFNRARKAIKDMFLSERSEEQIIKCMEWFAEKASSDNKKFEWTKSWIIETIRKKIPEFLAGKLEKEEEAIIPSYAKAWLK